MKNRISLLICLICLLVLPGCSKKNFLDLYGEEATAYYWWTIDSAGQWMEIDTNPYDWDDKYAASYVEAADNKITEVLGELGFSSTVAKEMELTRAIDGRKTATAGKYEVSWTYHPDEGLEVLFKIVP